MRDINALFAVGCIASVDDEPRDICHTIDPMGTAHVISIFRSCLEHYLGGSFHVVTVKNDFFHASVFIIVVNQRSEQFVRQASANLVGITLLLGVLKPVNPGLDEVCTSFPISQVLLAVSKCDFEGGVLDFVFTISTAK
jgi:hypothetical protein